MITSIPEELLERVAERFRVLADATRLSLLRILLSDGEQTVGDLVRRLETSQGNVSRHLRVLYDAGIVARRPQGTAVYYRIADPSIAALCDLVCARLRDQAETTAREFAGTP